MKILLHFKTHQWEIPDTDLVREKFLDIMAPMPDDLNEIGVLGEDTSGDDDDFESSIYTDDEYYEDDLDDEHYEDDSDNSIPESSVPSNWADDSDDE